MAADLGLVVHAAERHAHELAAHGARDRLAERGLADAGRADEAQDRRLALRRELAHGEIFDDAPLDLRQAVVIGVEDAPRLLDVDRLLLGQLPGQFDQPVEIGAHHAVFGGAFGHALQAAQLLAGGVLDFLRHAGFGDGLVELGHLGGLAFLAFTQLLLDRGHLLAQQHLALPLVERRLGLLADLGRQPQHLDAVRQQLGHLVHARGNVDGLQHFLLLVRLHVHVGHGHVGERARLLDRLHGADTSSRGACGSSSSASSAWPRKCSRRASISGVLGCRLRDAQHARDQERPAAEEFDDLEALVALAHQVMGAAADR